ncbi:MAG: HDOD domain-containing protein, partial [Planctomycetota bacterium]
MNVHVLEAIKRSAAVPSVPQVVMRFLEVIQDPDFEYDDLAKLLSVDPGTVSEILRLTNSALFGIAKKITSLRQALTLLGPKRTRSLVLGRYLVEALSGRTTPALDANYFWRRSLVSAVLAARFADAVAPRQREEVFICALLADIGIPVLAQALPDEYQPLLSRYAPHGQPFTDDEEREAVEVTHGEVSALVLEHWGLPDHVCAAVTCHHATVTGDDDPAVFARLVGSSDRIAKFLCEIPDVTEVAEVCAEATQSAGIELQTLCVILGEIEHDVEELATILRIDVIPSTVY